ncbi:MAG: hypothetical protein RLZZ324_307 [Candidatus Parcubacteria bacterium]|jgi:AmmeMemoRadiSam system protein B
MSLVFSCVTPHTPLLLPTVGKEGLALIKKTKESMELLEKELYVAQPEIIVVLTPHGAALPDAVSVNLNDKYVSNFAEFGDLATKLQWKSALHLVDRIREDFKEKKLPLVLCSEEHLDYGTAVPLSYLTAHHPDIRVVPIIMSNLDMKTHYVMGKELKDEIMRSEKRIAIVASADLSHRVGEQSPAGFSPRGVAFDDKIVDIITRKNPLGVMDIDEAWVTEAGACGAKVLAMFCGIMDDVHHEATLLSYEKPFGVGYAVAGMKIA